MNDTTLDPEAASLVLAMRSSAAAEHVLAGLTAEDYSDECCRAVWTAMRTVRADGASPDPALVAERLADTARGDCVRTLLDTVSPEHVPSGANAEHYVRMVRERAARRRLTGRLGDVLGRLQVGADLAEVRAEVRELLDDGAGEPAARAVDVDTFLGEDEPAHDWRLPGLIEVGDRLILTAAEGDGKSTLLRQVGVQAAAGIHPFTLDSIDPIRVLYVDLENSRSHVRRQLRPLRAAAGGRLDDPDRFRVEVIPEGLDLLRAGDAARLASIADDAAPELLAVGPLYKLATGDPTVEEVARQVAYVLDGIRTRQGCALLIEAHTPHGGSSSRPQRPYGASLWLRWPEFGIHLGSHGTLRHWRGARDERDWPTRLRRGGAWPWTVPAAPPEPDDDPTDLADTIADVLRRDGELTTNQLTDRIEGRRQEVLDTIHALAANPDSPVTTRSGPRNATLYRIENTDALPV